MIFREWKYEDIAAISELEKACFRDPWSFQMLADSFMGGRFRTILCEEDGKIVGCGGINLADERTTGKISWDILHPEYQGRSLGTRLLRFRIEKLGSLGGIRRITVRTSQLAFGFYRKQGFVLKEVKKDYWAEGFDLYAMEYGGWK